MYYTFECYINIKGFAVHPIEQIGSVPRDNNVTSLLSALSGVFNIAKQVTVTLNSEAVK